MKKLLLISVVVLVMAFSIPAQAGRPFIIEESGSFISQGTPIKTDSNPRTADLVITNGKGQGFGQTNTQSVIEWGTFDQTCDTGGPGSDLVSGSSVIRTVKGLVFVQFREGKNCVNLSSDVPPKVLSADITLEGEVTGGTGFYEGATGEISVTGTVYPVLVTPGPAVQFGGVELRGKVTWISH
jgi:hypothetical protein